MPQPNAQLKGRELKPLQRAMIHGMFTAGAKAAAIARLFRVHRSTIGRTLQTHSDTTQFKSQPRGWPRKTTGRADRRLYRHVISGFRERRQHLQEVQQNLLPDVSIQTVRRRLSEDNIRKWRATERPLLTDHNKQLRLEWAQRYQHLTAEDLCDVVWSDEMSVSKSDGKQATWVFRTPQEKWHQDCIEPMSNETRSSVMF